MLRDLSNNTHVYIACGYTDLRKGIDGLSQLIYSTFKMDPYEIGNVFFFCGKKTDRIKALLYEGDGFVLLYKRLSKGRFQWPRSTEELKNVTYEEYKLLMQGFSIERTKPAKDFHPKVL